MRALEKARLIDEGKGWEGCEFARCGRTDKGVSGAGQVVNLWIRSARRKEDAGGPEGAWRDATEPLPPRIHRQGSTTGPVESSSAPWRSDGQDQPPEPAETASKMVKSTVELPYVKILNSHLPPSFRILGWSPVDTGFDARFSCQFRHYKYAFHRVPSPGHPPLDLNAMRQGAERLLGEHDFRNFCKVDGSKQIENHHRRVLRAWFDEPTSSSESTHCSSGPRDLEWVNGGPAEDDGTDNRNALVASDEQSSPSHVPDGMIVFNLVGTAFLWHQVRHILAILFLIGSKLEDPSIITELLDVEKTPRRPLYMMAHGLPLRLHQCGYPPGELDWRVSSYGGPTSALGLSEESSAAGVVGSEDDEIERAGRIKILRALEARRQEAEIRLWQTRGALDRFKEVFGEPESRGEGSRGSHCGPMVGSPAAEFVGYPFGGGEMVTGNKYIPISQLKVGETVEDINRNYREGRGRIKLARREADEEDE